MSLQVRRASYALGAEIIGVDLRKPLNNEIFAHIHKVFLESCFIFFREQRLTQEQHIEFTRWFGEIDTNPEAGVRFVHPEHQEILLVFNPRVKGKPSDPYQGEHWHSDRSFTCRPTAISLLRSIEIPQVGGDTMFANMYLAYETLSDGMKELIEGLEAVHVVGDSALRRERGLETPPVAQPVVRVHPETGRKALYIGQYPKVLQFVGMTAEESRPLIEFLCAHATRPQFCYRHVWQKNDLVVWDNRCLMHNALGDYDRSQARDMERTTVIGKPSGYIYKGPVI